MVNDISKIDKNFVVETKIEKEGLKFHSPLEKPFKLYGVFYADGFYRRMPEEVGKNIERIHWGINRTAGGRVRFKTNSPYVAINAKMPHVFRMPHVAATATCGFDLYIKENGEFVHAKTFVPTPGMSTGYESLVEFGEPEKISEIGVDRKDAMKEIMIHFPSYSSVSELYIGLDKNAVIEEADDYKHEGVVVFAGSSITQGGCASRPGNAYDQILSRKCDVDIVNLGFSGSFRGQTGIAEYINTLPMCAFVLDYDHNAVTTEELENTHEKFFKIVRDAHPDLPIIMLPRPKYNLYDYEQKRFEVIRKTYDNAVANGDKNVYILTSRQLMEFAGPDGTVDDTHPTDLGFASMAKAVEPLLKEILNK